MDKKQKERIYNFSDSFMNSKSYRNYDDFFIVQELLQDISNEFNLPFEFMFTGGENAQMKAVFYSSKIGRYVIIDNDWYLPFSNTGAFVDTLEETWKEFERIELLLAQIKI